MKTLSIILFFILLAFSCNQTKTGNTTQQSINPNGDSELALLMRAMYDEAEQMKQQLEKGEPLKLSVDHPAILTANATEPDKVASTEYQVFASVYLQQIKNIQQADSSQLAGMYDQMINNCMNCHKALCPGPMVKIKKLYAPIVD